MPKKGGDGDAFGLDKKKVGPQPFNPRVLRSRLVSSALDAFRPSWEGLVAEGSHFERAERSANLTPYPAASERPAGSWWLLLLDQSWL